MIILAALPVIRAAAQAPYSNPVSGKLTLAPMATHGLLRAPVITLRMTATGGDHFRFAVSLDGRNWTEVGEPTAGDYLPPWDRAARVALTAGGASGAAAKFEWFRIAPKKAMRGAR